MTESEARVGPFWDWAVAAYGREGVAEACLDLQDTHGQNVPLILWAAWAYIQGYAVDETMAAKATSIAQVWAGTVIEPLRGMRRRLKTELTPEDSVSRLALREKIKAVELQSERALMIELESLIGVNIKKNYDVNHVVKYDLAVVMAQVSAQPSTDGLQMGLIRLAEALIKR